LISLYFVNAPEEEGDWIEKPAAYFGVCKEGSVGGVGLSQVKNKQRNMRTYINVVVLSLLSLPGLPVVSCIRKGQVVWHPVEPSESERVGGPQR